MLISKSQSKRCTFCSQVVGNYKCFSSSVLMRNEGGGKGDNIFLWGKDDDLFQFIIQHVLNFTLGCL